MFVTTYMRPRVIVGLTLCLSAALTQDAFPQRPATLREQRSPTFEDAIQVASFADLTIAPDGSRALYRVLRPDVGANTTGQTLWMQSLVGPLQREDMTGFLAGAYRFRWGRPPRSSDLYFIRDGKLFKSSLQSPRSVLEVYPADAQVNKRVLDYSISPSGRFLAVVLQQDDRNLRAKQAREGFRFDDEKTALGFTGATYAIPKELFVRDLADGKDLSVAASRFGVYDLAWSPDNEHLAYALGIDPDPVAESHAYFRETLRVWNAAGRTSRPIDVPVFSTVLSLAWLRSDLLAASTSFNAVVQHIHVIRFHEDQAEVAESPYTLRHPFVSSNPHAGLVVNGPRNGKGVLLQMDQRTFADKSLVDSDLNLSQCAVAENSASAVCVGENLAVPPEIVAVDLQSRHVRSLTAENEDKRSLALSPVVRLELGPNEEAAYLVYPNEYRTGTTYPTICIGYATPAFENWYSLGESNYADYPAQVFASLGYAVLLVNPALLRAPFYRAGDFRGAKAFFLDQPERALADAVAKGIALGVVDPQRVAMMGTSLGGFLTEHATVHTGLFRTGIARESDDHDPSRWWIDGSATIRWSYGEAIFGSDLTGPDAAERYRQFSPSRGVSPQSPPLMLETASDRAIYSMEMFGSLRRNHVPTDLFLYPGEGHNFSQPVHKLMVMKRDLWWLDYWLRDKMDSDPEAVALYERWTEMRSRKP